MTITRPSTFARRLIVSALLVSTASAATRAQTLSAGDLARASLEELMNIKITSAERKEQRADDVPAAVYVITQDDIRRSGMTKLPEIFRLVPGMQVAQMNASEWAVSVRGFNSVYSDKLLVLIDGRSLYNRGFSGVFWDAQNVVVSDIDRIEVIRGPGGTAWGANAVNGVINIITKSAADTKGTAVDVSAGTFERASGAIRHGGALGSVDYRVYSQWSDPGDGLTEARTSADDGYRALTTGTRADWSSGRDSLMGQATYTHTEAQPHWLKTANFVDPPSSEGVSDIDETAILGRWTHRGAGSTFQMQAFRTVNRRDETTLLASERTADLDVQYQTSLGARHDVVVGGGVRDSALMTRRSFTLLIPPDSATVYNGFVQDEFAVSRSVKVTVGSKLEHDTYAGWGLLPSARVMWNIDPSQRAWAGVSRARRTPSAAYRGMQIYYASIPGDQGVPIVFGLLGNPDYKSEELVALEGGYRVQLGPTASIDVAVFRGRYDNSTTVEPLAPSFELTPSPHVFVGAQYGNLLNVTSQGVEISGRWSPAPTWRLDGVYSTAHFTSSLDAGSQDAAAAIFDGSAPQHQWQLHSTNQLSARVQVDGGVYYVGRLRQAAIPAYTRADARAEFKLTDQLSAVAVAQNIFQAVHKEFSDFQTGLVGSMVPRSGRVQLRWRF
ncbi:MAG TPA: TonB-dependent receptor [Vicinamibacterales bacterium]|nr:TonB-dependent receptor [Vicinamibacterales bacterium]